MVTSTAEKVTGDPLRLAPVVADLLPVEVFQSRRNRRVRRLVVFAMIVFTLLLAGWFAGEYVRTVAQQADLDAANDTVTDLQVRQHQYDELQRVQQQTAAIESQLAAAMAIDIQWASILNSLRGSAPAGVNLTGIGSTVANDPRAASAARSATATTTIGSVTVNGIGTSKELVARYVDALATVDGFANPFLLSAAEEKDGVAFAVQVDITGAALESRFVSRKAAGK
jgi:Tfp pilus assembly protein PilN